MPARSRVDPETKQALKRTERRDGSRQAPRRNQVGVGAEPRRRRRRGANGSSKRGLPGWPCFAREPPGVERRRAFRRSDTALPGCPPSRASSCRLWRVKCSPLRTAAVKPRARPLRTAAARRKRSPPRREKRSLGCRAVSLCRRCTARRAWRQSSSCRAARGFGAGAAPARPWPRPCTGRPGAADRRSCCPTRDV